ICRVASQTSDGAGNRPGLIVCVAVVSAYHAAKTTTNVATPIHADRRPCASVTEALQSARFANAFSFGSASTMRRYSSVMYLLDAGACANVPFACMKPPIFVNQSSTSDAPPDGRFMILSWLERSNVGRVVNSFFIDASLIVTPPCS